MMICTCQPFDLKERNGHSASCNREQRKAEKESSKPAKSKKPIAKVGNKNTFECSDGRRVTQVEIIERLHKIYSACDKEENRIGTTYCRGCGSLALSHAHIIPQARCKKIGKTELIWQMGNWFYACFDCNAAIENPKGQDWKKLKNIDKCIKFIAEHDYELFQKFQANSLIDLLQFTEPHKI